MMSVNLSRSLPKDVMNCIFSFCDFKTKGDLVTTNKKIKDVIYFFRKHLFLGAWAKPNHALSLIVQSPKITKLVCENFDYNDDSLYALTKLLPKMNFFSMENSSSISNTGLNQLADNCKELSTLVINLKNITDEGFSSFSLKLPHLKKLSTYQTFEITHKGLCAAIQNFKQLEALELVHFYDFNPMVLSVLAENCKNLKFLSVHDGKNNNLTLECIREFVKKCNSLTYLKISYDLANLTHIKQIFQEFPNLQRPAFRMFYSI